MCGGGGGDVGRRREDGKGGGGSLVRAGGVGNDGVNVLFSLVTDA